MTQNRLIRLAKPPDAIVTVTIRSLVQDDVEQIDAIWQGILRELQQPDSSWDWAYKLRLARILYLHLTQSSCAFSLTLTTPTLDQCSSRGFGACS
ncbi:MAG: hypothetical protein AAF959_16430 [Cyanobacteria bacterium P01_D01_bin.56]